MEWPEEFYEMRGGVGCPMCAEGRPDATPQGIRVFAGKVADALSAADVDPARTLGRDLAWAARRGAQRAH